MFGGCEIVSQSVPRVLVVDLLNFFQPDGAAARRVSLSRKSSSNANEDVPEPGGPILAQISGYVGESSGDTAPVLLASVFLALQCPRPDRSFHRLAVVMSHSVCHLCRARLMGSSLRALPATNSDGRPILSKSPHHGVLNITGQCPTIPIYIHNGMFLPGFDLAPAMPSSSTALPDATCPVSHQPNRGVSAQHAMC